MLSIKQLLSFKIAASEGSFTSAAKKLNLTAAAVGKHIKSLEDHIGDNLFIRTTREIRLTDLGNAFYKQSERILEEVEKTEDLIADYKGLAAGRLKVASSIHFGEYHIAPYLTEFMATYPNIIIEFELADRIPDIESENIDILFGLMSGLPPHYVQRKLMDDHYLFCASPAYIKKVAAPQKLEDLANHIFITHSKRPTPTQLKTVKDTAINIKPRLWTNSTHAMLQCCMDGLGVAMLHSEVVAEAIKEGALVEILKQYRQPKQPLYLYFKKAQYVQPKMRVFIDFILKKINKKDHLA